MRNFELLFNEISDAMFLHDIEGNILRVNNYACEILGYTKEEFASMNVNEFAPDDILQNWESRMEIIKKNGQFCFETSYLTKDGQQLHVELISKIITMDNRLFVLSSGRDISIRKNYEHQLKEAKDTAEESRHELESIFNKVATTVILFDEDSKILKINSKGIIDFKVDKENLGTMRIGEAINCINTYNGVAKCDYSDACLKCQLSEIIKNTISQNKKYDREEIKISLLQDNTVVDKTLLISTTLLKKNGKSTYLATIDDITSWKQMEMDLNSAKEKAEESDKLKSAFLNNISHEIRTPLNGILGFISFFENDDLNLSKEERQQFIEIIHKSGERLANTVNDLVEVSKLDSGIHILAKENVLLSREMQSFVKEQNRQFENTNILLKYEIDSELEELHLTVDKVKIFHILKNLVNNAFKFSRIGSVNISVTKTSSELVFSVEDSGIGIDLKYKDCIYEPFRQVELGPAKDYDGSGLGLTIAKKLVEKLGGDIWFESEIGKGTRFYFTCPLKIADNEEIITQKVIEPKSGKFKLSSKKILIAEDEISNYQYLEVILSNQGCSLAHALNGKEALELFKSDPSFDLIIMDIKMPVMDGVEATQKIKEIRKDVPIVACSAYGLNNEKQKVMEAGCIDYLEKPVDSKKIITTIEKYVLHQKTYM
jgi:PAS domain S-box-containing protein